MGANHYNSSITASRPGGGQAAETPKPIEYRVGAGGLYQTVRDAALIEDEVRWMVQCGTKLEDIKITVQVPE